MEPEVRGKAGDWRMAIILLGGSSSSWILEEGAMDQRRVSKWQPVDALGW